LRETSQDNEGSLDLLLDTICNMFGGIVLIAILLATISQLAGSGARAVKEASSEKTGEVTPEEWEKQGQTIRELTNEIQQLLLVVGTNEASVTADGTLDDWKAAFGKASRDLDEARSNRNAVVVEMAERSNELARMTEETRKAPPMEQEAGDLVQLFLAVRYGKLYVAQDTSRTGPPRDYDNSRVDVAPLPDGSVLVDFPADKGETVAAGCENTGAFREALQNAQSRKEYFHFVVYPDSYAQFNYVKNVVIGKGFRYTWSPLKPDTTVRIVPFGEGGGPGPGVF